MDDTIPKKLDDILNESVDFLRQKNVYDCFISAFKRRGEWKVEVKLMMPSKDACDLWVEFIGVLIDKGMDTDYPMVHFGRSKYYDEEAQHSR